MRFGSLGEWVEEGLKAEGVWETSPVVCVAFRT